MRGRKPKFIDANSVDAWDAWFRWRQGGLLRDISIEDTWARVTGTLAGAEQAPGAALFARQLRDALSAWKLLPDPRIVATAGTERPDWPHDDLAATLNAAAFVLGAPGRASFDHAAFAATAALAVRMLDNAARLAAAGADRNAGQARIGLIGLADALALLGLPYDSAEARDQAGRIARSLAEGCLQGDIRLAGERGARMPPAASVNPPELALAAGEWRHAGRRHARLTAITSQRRLALLANNVADALDPLPDPPQAQAAAGRPPRSQTAPQSPSPASARAQLLMRGAMQPWIDRPIDYPVLAGGGLAPDPGDQRLARDLGLGPLRLRRPSGDLA